MAYLCATRYANYSGLSVSATAHRASGTAPLAVFFDATATTDSAVTYPFHELLYIWDFGDSGSGTFSYGARASISQNAAYGPLAAHVYQTAGTYTPTVTVFNGYASKKYTLPDVVVAAADTTFSTTNTTCVSTSGDFTGKPTGASEVTSSDFDVALAAALGSGKRVLFRGGETFTSTAKVSFTGSLAHIGSFGTGRALVQTASGSEEILRVSSTASDLRVVNIDFSGTGTNDSSFMSFQNTAWTNCLVLSCYIHDFENYLGGANWANSGGSGLFVFGNRLESPASGSTLDMILAGEGSKVAIVGNNCDQNNLGQQNIRLNKIDKYVVSCNTVSNALTAKELIAFRSDSGLDSQYGIVSDNACTLGNSYVGIFPSSANTGLGVFDMIIERNYISGAAPSGAYGIGTNAERISIRNNIIDASDVEMETGVNVRGTNGGLSLPSKDVWVYGNSVYSSKVSGTLSGVTVDSTASTGIVVKNNTMYAPGIAGVAVTDSGAVATKSNNSSTAQMAATSPFTDTTPSSSAAGDFNPANYAVAGGASVPVYDDAVSARRGYGNKTPTIDAGAVQTS